MAEQALFAKGQLLPAEAERNRRGRAADVSERGAQVERATERRGRRSNRLVGDARVVDIRLEALYGGARG